MSHHGQTHDLHITGDDHADQVLTVLLDQQYPMDSGYGFEGRPD